MTLSEWRSARGLSLRKAASLLRVSAATLSRIERGMGRPSWDTARLIHSGTNGRVKRDELMAANGGGEGYLTVVDDLRENGGAV